MRYMRLKKQEGVRLLKDIVFSKIPLDFLHNSPSKGRTIEGLLLCIKTKKSEKWVRYMRKIPLKTFPRNV